MWTPDLVEELLFRQFIKNEDVAGMLPPAPQVSDENYLERFDKATRVLFSYVRNGPVASLASQNVNTIASKHYNVTPSKPFLARTPAGAKPPPDPRQARTPTPKMSRAPSATKSGATSPQWKRVRIDWPSNVPTNNALKSNSRSKVAPLTAKRVAAQENIDPDLIFAQNPGDLPLNAIFAQYPKSLKSIAAMRNATGDWRTDTFNTEEELLYKRELGFQYVGPSQCSYGKGPFPQR